MYGRDRIHASELDMMLDYNMHVGRQKEVPALDLLDAWSQFRPESPPFVLNSDREKLVSRGAPATFVVHNGWRTAAQAPDFCKPGDTRLHLGLLPQPFCGDLRRAEVYVLLLNPGLGPQDYYGESEVPLYRDALLRNIKQSFLGDEIPFLFLDPKFAWHGGFDWWHGKLAAVIDHLAGRWQTSFSDARLRLGKVLASIELFPYHSASFKDQRRWLNTLSSVALARSFVRETVVRRVAAGDAIAIVARRVAEWDLPDMPGIVTYTPAQARSAHLTPDSPGGRALIRHLLRTGNTGLSSNKSLELTP